MYLPSKPQIFDFTSVIMTLVFFLGLYLPHLSVAQNVFSSNPNEAIFDYSDIDNFWNAFDKIDNKANPFIEYLENGSLGLKDFIPNRIENPAKLLKVVKRRYPDYESIRSKSNQVKSYEGHIREAYQQFKARYNEAIFPPTYYVIGAFNTGGTATENGLIIGVERQEYFEDLPYVVAHEIVHFNQNYPDERRSLLAQSITEGTADFIGELISGKYPNPGMFEYGNENEQILGAEFVTIMHDTNYHGWLYGSKGKKKGRPKDLGYWMGYKISQAYYAKATNKREAIIEMLTINDFDKYLHESGYLKEIIKQ